MVKSTAAPKGGTPKLELRPRSYGSPTYGQAARRSRRRRPRPRAATRERRRKTRRYAPRNEFFLLRDNGTRSTLGGRRLGLRASAEATSWTGESELDDEV